MLLLKVSASRDYDEQTLFTERCRYPLKNTAEGANRIMHSADPAHLMKGWSPTTSTVSSLSASVSNFCHTGGVAVGRRERPRPFEAIEKLIEKSWKSIEARATFLGHVQPVRSRSAMVRPKDKKREHCGPSYGNWTTVWLLVYPRLVALLFARCSSTGQRLGPDVARARVASRSFFSPIRCKPKRFNVFRIFSRVRRIDESIIIEKTWNAAARWAPIVSTSISANSILLYIECSIDND